jgi:hypothetical protein
MSQSEKKGWRDFTQLNYRRGLILMGAGALLGLVLAAIGLFSSKGTSTLLVPAEDIALVNQQPISRSDYLAQIRALYDVDMVHATSQQRRKVLDDMIREELFVQRGVELDVAAADPAVRMALVSAVEQQSATDAMTSVPSEEKLLAYYNKNKARYSSEGYVKMRDLVFPEKTGTAGLEAARELTADQAIAKFGAKDSGKVAPEEFYFAAQIHLGKQAAAVAEAMADGTVSSPVAMADGPHLFYVSRNVRPVAQDFQKAKAQILGDYRHDQVQSMLIHEQDFLRRRANILIADDLK